MRLEKIEKKKKLMYICGVPASHPGAGGKGCLVKAARQRHTQETSLFQNIQIDLAITGSNPIWQLTIEAKREAMGGDGVDGAE